MAVSSSPSPYQRVKRDIYREKFMGLLGPDLDSLKKSLCLSLTVYSFLSHERLTKGSLSFLQVQHTFHVSGNTE